MRILILGAGKMGSFFNDVLSFQHETAVFDGGWRATDGSPPQT